MKSKWLAISQGIWFAGIPIIIMLSFLLRLSGGQASAYLLGMPETLWFLLPAGLFSVVFVLMYLGVHAIPRAKRFGLLAFLSLVDGVYYVVVSSVYVIETGIDAL
ncbi:hypothetical protein L4C36_21970 [Photobacterium japonica]|uniref:hypothetical protein n=1 Tax=Photobacterium japonica TaxID=2910235 RepID=UPI003D0C3CAC